MRQQLASLPPVCNLADGFDIGDRFFYLDFVSMAICKKTLAERNEYLIRAEGLAGNDSTFKPILDAVGDAEIDWDSVLRMGNSWFDRQVEVLRMSDPIKRRTAKANINQETGQLRATIKDAASLRQLPAAERRKIASETLGRACVAVAAGSVDCDVITDRMAMGADLTQLSFALAAYRADHDAYPEQLDELRPKYLDRIPKDIFNDGKLHYSRQKEGYILYSVGLNGRDDGGRNGDDWTSGDEGWDDIVVRVPSAKSARTK
jgi:hypothetical protein